jgi:hypothetical protein
MEKRFKLSSKMPFVYPGAGKWKATIIGKVLKSVRAQKSQISGLN